MKFRPFQNTDPPALIEIWNEAGLGRGAFPVRSPVLFEYCVFSKPYFDPAGLIVAIDDGRLVGFVHAGFGPNAAETNLSTETGVVCAVVVRPSHRRQKIGTQLIHHAEEYLRQRGAKKIIAGGVPPWNPFYFGLYGGANLPGFLLTDAAAEPFFLRLGFSTWQSRLVFERRLNDYQSVIDPRFVALRRRYDVQLVPQPDIPSWWCECVFGLFEPFEFRLADRLTGIPAARVVGWEMTAGLTPQGHGSIGLLNVYVRPEVRRQGLARFLLNQMIRYIQEQFFQLVEVHIPEGDDPAIKLFQSLGFQQIDMGRSYQKVQEVHESEPAEVPPNA
jgi:ribosomal protein S18 acetylase RimI-like enzyme